MHGQCSALPNWFSKLLSTACYWLLLSAIACLECVDTEGLELAVRSARSSIFTTF